MIMTNLSIAIPVLQQLRSDQPVQMPLAEKEETRKHETQRIPNRAIYFLFSREFENSTKITMF